MREEIQKHVLNLKAAMDAWASDDNSDTRAQAYFCAGALSGASLSLVDSCETTDRRIAVGLELVIQTIIEREKKRP